MNYSAINRRLIRSRSHAFIAFFNFIAVPARRRPCTSLTFPIISPSQCLSALASVAGYCDGDRQRCGFYLVRHDRRPTAARKTQPVPATALEQPVVTQPVPAPAPAPRTALQAAPALRGPSVPVVAPFGGGAASAVVPALWRGPLVMQVQDLAEVEAPIGSSTPGTSTAAPRVPSLIGGVVLSASSKDGR